MTGFNTDWQTKLGIAVKCMLADPAIAETINKEHTKDTPKRVGKAFTEFFSGCLQDPREVLATKFPSDGYNQMVHIKGAQFYSVCAHHLVPFFGSCSFAYIPGEHVVGLSKIPRLIQTLARRPQVQEKLTQEIVDIFYDEIKPRGCGLVMRGIHFCMVSRGVQEQDSFTETTALRGIFSDNPAVKAEFVAAAQAHIKVWK